METPPARGRRAVRAGHILPSTARLQDEEDAIERAPVVVPFPARAGFLLRDQECNNSPLHIREVMSAHADSLA
jgi:hypothetical protein